jgi:L-malate glycosyltransferase
LRILHCVEFYSPSKGGVQEVVKQLSEKIQETGNQVAVATSFDEARIGDHVGNVEILQFRISGNKVRGILGTRAEKDRYRALLLSDRFDVIAFFMAQQWATDLAIPVVRRIKAKVVFVPTGMSKLNSRMYGEYYEDLSVFMRDISANVFLSERLRDYRFARERSASRTVIIPNGASEEEFGERRSGSDDIRAKYGIRKDEFLVLTVGSHTGLKGHDEAAAIFRRAGIPGSVLIINGNYNESRRIDSAVKNVGRLLRHISHIVTLKTVFLLPCPLKCKLLEAFGDARGGRKSGESGRVIVIETSRLETVELYREADLFLFASNLECSPIVLFECMASKIPFLTSDAGNAREIVEWSGGGKMLPGKTNSKGYSRTNIRSASRLLRVVFADREGRHRMAENGHQAWKEKFTWREISVKYLRLYESVTSK